MNDIDLPLMLQNVLEERRKRNHNYSVRAFARDLSISSGRLSDILNKKYIPGPTVSARIINSLALNQEEGENIRQIIENTQKTRKELGGAHQLREDELSMITEWQHFAILNLMETINYRDEFSWIAERLNLDEMTVKDSFRKMLSLGLIELRDGKHAPTYKDLTTTHNVPSSALREANRQVILQSLESLDVDSLELRDITSITLPINTANLPRAKEMARDFRRKIATLLEEGEKTEVYNICLQIVPVTRNNT